MTRMTDERLAELLAIQDALGDMLSPEELELGHAMKADRKRVRELEARLERVRKLPDRWRSREFPDEVAPADFIEDVCADELDEALADD